MGSGLNFINGNCVRINNVGIMSIKKISGRVG